MDGLAFRVLGPLSVEGPAGEVRLAGSRRRALLVRLLISANEVVPGGLLIEDLWEGDPPAGASSTLQSHVSAVRRVLGADRVQYRDGGYLLAVADGEIDAQLCEQETLAAQHARSHGDARTAEQLLARALGRWHGRALSDVATTVWASGEATRLEELRHRGLEAWLDARLELGDHAGVASDAELAVADHPLQEGLWAKLILGLYRSGRQSEALRAYRRLSRVLGEELGIEPSPELARLEQAVLLHEPEVQWTPQRTARHPVTGSSPERRSSDATIGSEARHDGELPAGTVTFFCTEIAESTRLLRTLGFRYGDVLNRQRVLLRAAVVDSGGVEVSVNGDSCLFAFGGAASAIAAAMAGQAALTAERWPDQASVGIRMALHTGEAAPNDGDYAALAVHQAVRVANAAHGGQILVSEVTAIVAGLPRGGTLRDLGLFRLKDFDAPARLYQLCPDSSSSEFPAPRAQPAVVGNLPIAVSSFIGREDELAQVNKLLGTHRLVSLVGPGGAGKTRLALEVAATQVDASVDGVWFVDLAAVSEPSLVPSVLADVLGVQQSDRPLIDVLASWVSDQRVLLVFDNCEHVLQASAELVERLLTSGRDVRVLATSRESLRIGGEWVWRVPPLGLPTMAGDVDIDEIQYADSVRLFVDRAAAVGPGVPLDDASVRATGEIVVRLDGLPLAIELAAARVGSLRVQDIVSGLDDRFGLLVDGFRTARPRHRTLLAAIEWSYQLLESTEQAVLRRLSVFAGTFTLSAAQAVASSGDVPATEVADVVLSLKAKSLVVPGAPTESHEGRVEPELRAPRFRLLETIRQYADDRLQQSDDGRELRQACADHAAHYLALAQTAEPQLYGEHQGQWLAMLELDHDNLRLALTRLADRATQPDDLLRMTVALRRFWHTHNHHQECLSHLEPALDKAAGTVPDLARAEALSLAAEIERFSDAATAQRYGDEALELAARHDAHAIASRCLGNALALAAHFSGDQASAMTLAEEAERLANQTDDLVVIGEALLNHALVAEEDFPLANRLNEAAIAVAQRSGDRATLAWAHNNLGSALLAAGDVESARRQIERAIAIFAELDSEKPQTLINLGWVHLQRGDSAAANATFSKAMRLARRGYLRTETAYGALGSALSASTRREWDRAAALHALADLELEAAGQRWAEPERSYRDADLGRLRRDMGDAFDLAYDTATAMSRDALMQLALEQAAGE